MNTINPVRPYVTMKNNPQTPNTQPTQPQTPAFKGVIGDKVVKQIAAKEAVTVAGIVGLAAGMIGLSKDKVSDIVESFVNRIKGLQTENENLTQQIQQEKTRAAQEKARAAQEKEALMKDFEQEKQQMQSGITHALVEKDLEVKEKDAKIAELQKYEAMAKVKSVEELDVVTPQQFVELLKEAEEANPKAEQSLLNYLFNGNGQEEFLEQIERSNKVLKARKDGITQIPEMEMAYENAGVYIGYDPAIVAQRMMERALMNSEQGVQVNYPPVRRQILENANAIILPMMDKCFHYNNSNEKILSDVSEFNNAIASNKAELIKKGWIFEQRNVNSKGRPYYTFVNDKKEKYDIYITDLASHSFGFGRTTYADGSVDAWTTNGYWE